MRGLVEDFGGPLAILVFAILGFVTIIGESFTLRRRLIVNFPILVFLLFPFISIFNFTTAALGVAVFAALSCVIVSRSTRVNPLRVKAACRHTCPRNDTRTVAEPM
jgi:hypothetical protein